MVLRWAAASYWLVAGSICLVQTASAQTASTLLGDTLRTPSGLRYLLDVRGNGPTAQPGDRMVVTYSGFLPNGKIFDSSAMDGRPLRLRVGRGEVIKGWDELLPLLPAGTRTRVWIPAALAYGAKGVRNPDNEATYLIPPNTNLLFDITVVKIK